MRPLAPLPTRIILVLPALLVAFQINAAAQQFQLGSVYTVGAEPQRVVVADFNHDGKPDLATVDFYFATGIGPDGIAAADLNKDGKVGLVVANNNFESPSVISVLMGNGDGTFQRQVKYNAGAGPAGVAIADFNRDGFFDIAIANVGDSTLSLFFGQGAGRFGTAQTFAFNPGTVSISVAAAKLRSNHGPDLAVALDYANEVAILLNTN